MASNVLHLLRAGVASMFASLKGTTETTFHASAEIFLKRAQKASFAHDVSPFIADCKKMQSQKPPTLTSTLDPATGDITVGQFFFPRRLWSTIILKVHDDAMNILQILLDGSHWRDVTFTNIDSSRQTPPFVVTFSWRKGDSFYDNTSLQMAPSATDGAFNRLSAIIQMIFHGFSGSLRISQTESIEDFQVQYDTNQIARFYSSHQKVAVGQHTQKKHSAGMTEHYIPSHLVTIFLLYEQVCQLKKLGQEEGFVRWARASPFSLAEYFQEVFLLDRPPSAIQVRKFWTTLINYIFPSSTDGYITISTTEESSSQCHHHLSTHNNQYSALLKNGSQVWHKTLHSALGDPSADPVLYKPVDLVLTKQWLLHSLKVLLQRDDAIYLSTSQESLVWHSTNARKHVHISTSCGGGKSMSWLLRVFALKLAKKDPGVSIIAVPYCFLAASHQQAAEKLFKQTVPLGITSCAITMVDLVHDDLPKGLEKDLPNLIFVSVDAIDKIIQDHMGWLQGLAEKGKLRRIFIDEIHLALCEPVFRTGYDHLWKLSQLKIPIITLSGTLPLALVPVMASKLRMTLDKTGATDLVIVEGGDPLGSNITLTIRSLDSDEQETQSGVAKATKYLTSYPTKAVHIIGASIHRVNQVAEMIKKNTTFSVEMVTSETASVEQSRIAKAWLSEKIQILCSTTCALVGNENKRCGLIIIIGNLYSTSQLIQAINRLRPQYRDDFAEVFVVSKKVNIDYCRTMDKATDQLISQLIDTRDFSDNREVREKQIQSFRYAFGYRSLYSFIHRCSVHECRIRTLCRYMAFARESNCSRCCYCMNGADVKGVEAATITTPILSTATKSKQEVSDLSNIKLTARLVFESLEHHCPACKLEDCDGENRLIRNNKEGKLQSFCTGQYWRCFRCGLRNPPVANGKKNSTTVIHNRQTCAISLPNTSGRMCTTCFDRFDRTKSVANVSHSLGGCPLKCRLRALLQQVWTGEDFRNCVIRMNSSEQNFYRVVCEAGVKAGILFSEKNLLPTEYKNMRATIENNGADNKISKKPEGDGNKRKNGPSEISTNLCASHVSKIAIVNPYAVAKKARNCYRSI